jgi:hypothetical protein
MPPFVGRLNKLFVALYKALGLAALALIFIGLTSYLGQQGFFLISTRWVAPTIVSALDDQVLRIETEVAEKAAARDKLAVERAQIRVEREHAMRTALEARAFQQRFQQAVRADRADRANALAELRALRPEIEAARGELAESGRAYTGLVRTRSEALRDARLVDREAYLTTNHQLAEQAVTRLAMSQRQVEIRQRLKEIERELPALDAAATLDWRSPAAPFTTRVLLQARAPARAKIEEEHAEDVRRALDEAVVQIDGSIARYDRLLATLRASPWLAALEGNIHVAFVPYENLGHAREGAPLFGCSAGLLACRRVGTVGRLFEGETSQKHPLRQSLLRGAMVRLDLADARWARASILYVGRAPLLF